MTWEGSGISASARAEAPISSAEMLGVMLLFIIICTFFTLARLYARFFVHQQLWWDDWAMVISWVGTIAFCALQLVWVRFGAGVNIWDVPQNEYRVFLKLWSAGQMAARVTIFFARLSILLFYIRIFYPVGSKRTILWWVIQVFIWLNILYSISLILVLSLQCAPYHLPWGSSCVNEFSVLINASAINIVSDIAVLVIPIASITKLQATRRKKWAIWALFAFATLAPVASLARLAYQIPVANGKNKTVIYPIILILATAEQVVAMIVGSAPIASGLVIRLFRKNRKLANTSPVKRDISQIIWPAREVTTGPTGRAQAARLDPYYITDTTDGVHTAPSHTDRTDRHGVGENV